MYRGSIGSGSASGASPACGSSASPTATARRADKALIDCSTRVTVERVFYPMNDWRSTLSGVNDHEADWEQVTVLLVPLVEDAERANRPTD